MLFLRVIGILTAITIGSSVLAWLLTHDRSYLTLAGRVTKGALIVALTILALTAAERLIIL